MNLSDLNIDKSWSIFLDRDGVINMRIVDGYVLDWEEFDLIPGALEAINIFSKLFGRIFIVTNQQGVGKGLMSEQKLKLIHQKLLRLVENESGKIDKIYFCTDLKEKPNNCRKPGIYMAEQAKADFPEIDFEKSVMVGDSISDMKFGQNAGMVNVFINFDEITIPENPTISLSFRYLIDFACELKREYNI